MTDSIKIVVRVRPFNTNQQGQNNVVQMDDQQVRLRNPQSGEIKKFGFHRCYWSTDDSQGKPPVNNMFVFNDIGKQILGHIYQGYNSTVFAYGQTGSGKSYSIQGYQEKGILQLCLQDIFERKKKQNDAQGISTQVKVTYLQIYNEKLRDLLNPNQKNQIKVQSAGTAVFISGVDPVLCESYDQVLKMFQDGKKIRVIGAHAMNKNSSRSHAVFTIYYKQVGKGKAIQSKFNIVDLAGSQRQSKTGATGVRLQQANNINKSLTNLGIIIETLANNCIKKQNSFVPYRNSLLTHILSESLGGNSKTFMIAAISPASSNYEQTLSTLRFAQRASMITTQSKKNVQQKQGYNKQLLAEIERLKKQLENASGKIINTHTHSHSINVQYITMEDQARADDLQTKINAMLQELQKNKTAMEDLEKQLEEERKKKIQMEQNRKKALKQAGLETDKQAQAKKNYPYLMNISDDPTLAGMLIYHLKQGQITIGTSQAQQNDIKLNALGIMKRHCSIISHQGQIFIVPKPQCKLFINGLSVTDKKLVKHLDRITLGHANTFKLVIPGQKNDLTVSVVKYGQFLDDRLNSDSQQAKSIKVFLEELQHRLDKDTFARFIEKFKGAVHDIDEANDYTTFRYKKYPLKSRNIQFRINAIIDIQNYIKGQPSLIILCQHKQTKQIQFIWSQQKFQARLAQMQGWYADVNGGSNTQSSFYQFDPWFDATDSFIKQKQRIEIMNAKQIHQFWTKKQTENSQIYKALLLQQKQILSKLNKNGADAQLIQNYADYYFRGYDIQQNTKIKCEKLRQKQQVHKSVKRFMQCCAQIQKCNLDNKAYNQSKNKYTQHKKQNKNKQSENKTNNNNNQIEAILQENVWMNLKIQQLSEQLRKKVKELNDEKKKNNK